MSLAASSNSVPSNTTNSPIEASKVYAKRGYKIEHQKIVVEIDFAKKSIEGFVDIKLTFFPHGRRFFDIKLNSRQCTITKVTINNEMELSYDLKNYLEQIVPDSEINNISIDNYNNYLRAAQSTSEDGELTIYLTDSLIRKWGSKESVAVNIQVHYVLLKPRGGIYFCLPDSSFPHRIPHLYTQYQQGGARMWFPCFDNPVDRCTFDMVYTVPASTVAVSSGELIKQVINKEHTKKTFYYTLDVPTCASSIGLAVGPFEILPEPDTTKGKFLTMATHFCLPGKLKDLEHITSFVSQAFYYFEEFLATLFPFKSYKQVFVDDAYTSVASFATLSIYSTHLLHDDTIIDQTFKSRRKLIYGLATQWFEHWIGIRSWPDLWISYGLSGYLAEQFCKKHFGNNDYRYRLLRQCEFVTNNDTQAISPANYLHPWEIMGTYVLRKKAALVMYMIERRIGGDSFRKFLSSCVSLSAGQVDLERNLATKKFLKTLKKISGQDLKAFAERWITGKGCYNLTCAFVFNKKKHIIEFALKQNKYIGTKIPGSLSVRVNEIDEGTYDHHIAFEDEFHSFDFPCHSRVRKARKKRKGQSEENPPPEEEEDQTKKNETPIQWVRVDPDLDVIRYLTFKQPELMWISQLEKDADVIAQYEAVIGLRQFTHSFPAVEALNNILCNSQIFYKVREHAAFSMAKSGSMGSGMLFKFFKSNYYEGNQLKPNDFSDLSKYFVCKATIDALSNVREGTKSPPEVIEFLLDLVKNSDNTLNTYSDNYYMATILRCITNIDSPRLTDNQKIEKHLDRYLNLEKVIPSYHNTITIACLKAICDLMVAKKIIVDLDKYKEYTKPGHFERVRITALECFLRLGFNKEGTTSFLLDLLENERSAYMKFKIIECMMTPQDVPETEFFQSYAREKHEENVALIRRLWMMLNSADTAYDGRLRVVISRFIQKVWGNNVYKILGGQDQKIVVKKPTISVKPPTLKRKPSEAQLSAKEANTSSSNLKFKITFKKPEDGVSGSPSSDSGSITVSTPPQTDITSNKPLRITEQTTTFKEEAPRPITKKQKVMKVQFSITDPTSGNKQLLATKDIKLKL